MNRPEIDYVIFEQSLPLMKLMQRSPSQELNIDCGGEDLFTLAGMLGKKGDCSRYF